MNENILELRNISKSFSGVEVLHDVSFALRPGEVHALLGENGAGKSTLVKIITGVHQPDKGDILLNGQPVHFSDARESRQAGIAAIYQELSLFPDLDVAENIFAGRQPVKPGGRVDWRKLYDEAGKLLESLGTKPRTSYVARVRNPNPLMPDYRPAPFMWEEYAKAHGDPLRHLRRGEPAAMEKSGGVK